MRPAVFGVADISLLLERAQHGQDGRVGEIVGDPLPNLGDGGRADVPEHAHHIEFSVGECNVHARFQLLML